jgi:DNA polymerase III delta prime subunit
MLTFLEEPPKGTVMLLCTDRVSSVLQTVVSRCQIVRFAFLSPREIRDELVARQHADPADPRLEEVIYTGALGRSLDLWNNPPQEANEEAIQLWDLCLQGDWTRTAQFIDHVAQAHDMSRYERLFTEIMERTRNAFLRELPNTENVFLGQQARCMRLKAPLSRLNYERIITLCQNTIDAIASYANIGMALAQFAIALSEVLNGKEQQAR